jgi:hypothetical protein
MHGCAAASIAIGKTVGVAPDSKLYFIANFFGHYVMVRAYIPQNTNTVDL